MQANTPRVAGGHFYYSVSGGVYRIPVGGGQYTKVHGSSARLLGVDSTYLYTMTYSPLEVFRSA